MTNDAIAKISQAMKLFLATDGLSAAVSGPYDSEALPGVSVAEVHLWLASREVTSGLLEDACEQVASALRGNGEKLDRLVVARGKEPEQGADGFVKYEFITSLTAGKAEDDGNLDFHERGLVNNTSSGMTLATVISPIDGTPGITVTGKELSAKPGKNAKAPASGAGVELSEDGTEYRATIEGHATLVGNRIQVTRELHIDSSIDYTTGNIDFVGDLVISGMVQSGFSVKAKGNITIKGSVERRAYVCAGGDVVVHETVRCGRKRVGVEANGTISAPRLDNSFIKARGDVLIAEEVINSKINCYGRFLSPEAEVRGCEIEAVGGMEINRVGSREGTNNELTAGITLGVSKQIIRAREGIESGRKRLIVLNNAFREKNGVIGEQPEALSHFSDKKREEFEAAQEEHNQRCGVVTERISKLEEAIVTLEKDMAEVPGAAIAIKERVFPLCVLNLGHNEWVIRKAMDGRIFFDDFNNNRIGIRSYKEGIFEEEVEEEEVLGLSDLQTLEEELNGRRLSATAFAKRLNAFAYEGSSLLKEAMTMGMAAVSQKRYQSHDVFASVGTIFVELARKCSDLKSRCKIGARGLMFLRKAITGNNLHAQAFSAMGELYDLINQYEKAEEAHKRAVYAIKIQKGMWEEGGILARYAFSLLLQSQATTDKGKRTELTQQAREVLTLAEKRGATGSIRDRCLAALGEQAVELNGEAS